MDELTECYNIHHIRNFFFRADTFTFNKDWVLELCELIRKSPLYGKIAYTANSRVRPLSQEVLNAMKDTGCFMVVFGFETGSKETIKRIKKGATIEDNKKAVEMAKKAQIPVCGFFMMGFPWETREHLRATRRFILNQDCDFIEIHIALPYYGTKLYDVCRENDVLAGSSLGRDVFHATTKGTSYLSEDYILRYRRDTLMMFYARPGYVIKKLYQSRGDIKIIRNYLKYGIRLVKNNILKQ